MVSTIACFWTLMEFIWIRVAFLRKLVEELKSEIVAKYGMVPLISILGNPLAWSKLPASIVSCPRN